jgi:alkanesulfonate monooxygenase SsuD/methylene tetrahydromethanopterin reductase-like flavin-dependent oxidoreductase (luciferase family)
MAEAGARGIKGMIAGSTSLAARPLKVGLTLPTFEQAMMGATPRWNDFKTMAQHAEAIGFASLWVPDHMIHNAFQPDVQLGAWDCWSILSSLAAVTTRIELGTLVVCTNFRNPALLAKMADTVEEISGGRLILGLGAGYYEREFRAFGFPFDHVVGRFEEALAIVHALLRKGKVDFDGQYYQARDCELIPRGPRPGGPPIMIGAKQDRPRALRLTARYADYWNAFAINRAEDVVPMVEAVDAACRKISRDPATLCKTVTVVVDLPDCRKDAPSTAWTRLIPTMKPLAGTSEELAEALRGYSRAGVSHVQIWLEPFNRAAIDAFAPVLELLDAG